MEEFLNLEFFSLKPEYIKIIAFVWSIIKCTLLFVVSFKLLHFLSDKILKHINSRISTQERKQQLETLKTIFVHVVATVIVAVYIMSMLSLFGIDIRPLLATAGVLGVAVGFGAKKSVEDIICGITIILEGQIRVGDYVEIQGMKGFVEKITLPLITVRCDQTGAVYFIRCGFIDSIKNHTMHYSYSFFPLEVAYSTDINHAFKVLKKCFEILKQNDDYNKLILGDLEIWGLDAFNESSICIKARIKTQPKGQWTIKRAFNKIVKEQFEKENIEIPFNQIVVTNA